MSGKNITVLAFGSSGDLVPYLALAVGLQSAGYRVRFVTHARFESIVRRYDLSLAIIDDDPGIALAGETGHQLVASGANPVKSLRSLVKALRSRLPYYADYVLHQSKDAEIVIASILASFVAVHVAERLEIRYIPAFIQPVTPSSEIANAFVPTLFPTALENWLSHQIYYRFASLAFRRLMRDVRHTLGLKPTTSCEPFAGVHHQQIPVLYGYSSAILPKPGKWKERTHVTGYWFLPSGPDWQAPAPLSDFLKSGPPPVCVGFGSMMDRDPEGITAMVLEALRRVGCRGLLLTGWGALKVPLSLPSDVFAVESVPHEWLFPSVAAAVHHAGAGTTAATLRAGIPSVAVPFIGDQFFWAEQLYRLGAAPKPVPRLKLSVDSLAKAVRAAISNEDLRQKAGRLACKLRSEDGVKNAVDVLGRYLPLD
jgi:sterol 3beta-glucosyltransferase